MRNCENDDTMCDDIWQKLKKRNMYLNLNTLRNMNFAKDLNSVEKPILINIFHVCGVDQYIACLIHEFIYKEVVELFENNNVKTKYVTKYCVMDGFFQSWHPNGNKHVVSVLIRMVSLMVNIDSGIIMEISKSKVCIVMVNMMGCTEVGLKMVTWK